MSYKWGVLIEWRGEKSILEFDEDEYEKAIEFVEKLPKELKSRFIGACGTN